MRLHVTKDKVKRQYTAAANPRWDHHLWVSQDFSLLCTLHDYSDPWSVVLDTVGTHEIFLELISAGSWYLYLLDITSISRQGQR